jgi:hypothetical protein
MARLPLPAVSINEIALYARIAAFVGEELRRLGRQERSWTRFRIASAVVGELHSGRTWSTNKRRLACGCHSKDFREHLARVYESALQVARRGVSDEDGLGVDMRLTLGA